MHLLTGATGYVGGRLLRRLEHDGVFVRCLCRNPEALDAAFSGVDAAFYLVHSMHSGSRFEAQEREAAANFARAAREAGVRRIIYLGGLAHGGELSPSYAQPYCDRRHTSFQRHSRDRIASLDRARAQNS